MADVTTCARHPEVETRLRCSTCETPICPSCGREAAVGFKCPDCAAHAEGTTSRRDGEGGMLARLTRPAGSRSDTADDAPARTPAGDQGARLPGNLGTRATLVGFAAAVLGGFVLGPVLQGGAFFLLSAGVIGWGVSRAVYWATEERNSPYVRALALTMAVVTVAIGMGVAGSMTGGRPDGIAFLAYPAALYGGWIVVRQR